jgi:hypothetical protein
MVKRRVAFTDRFRQAVETLPPAEAAALLGELRELISAYTAARVAPALVLLECLQEGDQIGLLPGAQAHVEAAVIERHDVFERRGEPVVEVRGARGQAAQNRPLEPPDVLPLAADQRPAGVGGLHRLAAAPVAQRVQWHVGCPPRGVGQPEVQRRLDRVVAHVRRVMAGGAGAGDARGIQLVVEALDPGDRDRMGVEERLAVRDRLSRRRSLAVIGARQCSPGVEDREDPRVERRVGRVLPKRVVDADEEVLPRQGERAAPGALGLELAGRGIGVLSREQREFEPDDLPGLLIGQVLEGLGVAAGGPWACPVSVSSSEAPRFSRPSHITVLRKRRFVDGSGRRNRDSSLLPAKP